MQTEPTKLNGPVTCGMMDNAFFCAYVKAILALVDYVKYALRGKDTHSDKLNRDERREGRGGKVSAHLVLIFENLICGIACLSVFPSPDPRQVNFWRVYFEVDLRFQLTFNIDRAKFSTIQPERCNKDEIPRRQSGVSVWMGDPAASADGMF